MENSPLNKAHQLERRAEALLRQKKFEECIECHKIAMKYLHEALLLTENPRSKESIQLQIDSHQKLVDGLKIRKTQYEEHRRHMEVLRQRLGHIDYDCEDKESLQNEIFRTMEIHDSLIEILIKRGNADDDCLSYSTSDTDEKGSGSDACDGGGGGVNVVQGKNKKHVDDSILIEEFRSLSEKLRDIVQILALQLEEKDTEIIELKAEIRRLQNEKNKGENRANSTLKVIMDSSGGTSPFVFSPCSELSPDVHDARGLPVLAPLEMPNFDFASLVKNTANLNLNSTNNK